MSELDRLRTILANERTLLAYIRTALALLIFGMAAIKFFHDALVIVAFGWIFMASGVTTFVWGTLHFRRIAKSIKESEGSQ